ncbi:glycosyltransferase family 2 protein [Campylobacter sp. FMV-PI01]|uniref:Glycosyltransferase family 2 protein n=1 Tax=Campylobacter portucalensis TaxID=2608384 RepID=A0A6L5WLF7_9BACT|nr:glycosyltransferase family 2 protein [Campylobacter portucalensis]MSN96541.1 glycosyltransferase family 2 protein [Campylobacter portucalensis]
MISAVVLVKNNELTLEKTLKSLEFLDEVIVYDNGSTDNSINITKSFKNVNLINGEFMGFGKTKNRAASFAKNEWILVIDSDEVVDDELKEVLKTKNLDKNYVYKLNFKAFYKDIEIKHCGWNNQKIKRLYNKNITSYNQNDVHEDIIIDGLKTENLAGNVKHYSYHSISEFIQKADLYSTLFAKNNASKRTSSPTKAFFNAFYSFIKTYFFKKGFLDGYAGLIIAVSHAVTNFYKYIKLYEINNETTNNKTR